MHAPSTSSESKQWPLQAVISLYVLVASAIAISAVWWFEGAFATALSEQTLAGLVNAEKVVTADIGAKLAAAESSVLRYGALVSQIGAITQYDRAAEFDLIASKFPDGTYRTRRELFDPATKAGFWACAGAVLDEGWRDFYVRATELTATFGSGALNGIVTDTGIVPSNRGNIIFWPASAEYIYDGAPDLDYHDMQWYTLALPANNPDGLVRWTNTQPDPTVKKWIVSVVAPFTRLGKFGGSVVHDVLVDQLLETVLALNPLHGTETFVVSVEGLLILSDVYDAQIKTANGPLALAELPDPKIRAVAQEALAAAVKSAPASTDLLRSAGFVALSTRIAGPGWVVLRIVPEAAISAVAVRPLKRLRFALTFLLGSALLGLLTTVYREMKQRRMAEAQGAEREALVQQLVERSPGVVAIKDWSGRYLLTSDVFARMAGRPPKDIVGCTDRDLFPTELADRFESAEKKIRDEGAQPPQEELWNLPGGEYWIVLVRFPLIGPDGMPFAIGWIGTDITGQRSLEERLREAAKMEAIGRLAGGIAHDYNNLTTAIIGFSEMLSLSMDAKDPRQSDLHEIKLAGRRAADLSQQLLTFARRKVIAPRSIDVGTVLRELHRMVQQMIGEHIELVTLVTESLPLIRIDPSQFQQVIMNLAVNARDAMPQGGKLTVQADLAPVEDSQAGAVHWVRLRVSDTGVGISAETIRRIFEPFYTTKEIGRGTGLGLAICYGVIKQAGGHISVESELGVGTTFTLLLPPTTGAADLLHPQLLPPRDLSGSETLLIVEDERQVREVMVRGLTALGYNLIVAQNGEDAFARLSALDQPPALVVTDVVMPLLSGSMLSVRLRERWPDQRILFVSGYTENENLLRGNLPKNTWFLPKPFSIPQLSALIREALR